MQAEVDLAIVGGGPAGIAAALFLSAAAPHRRGRIVVLERDEAPEATISPLWDSFCGTSAGGWQGIATAVSPVTGEREAVGLVDARVVVESVEETTDPADGSVRSVVKTRTKTVKKDVLALATYTVERRTGGRAGGGGTDRLTRRTIRSPTTAGLVAAAAAAEADAGGEADDGGGGDDDATPITSPSSPSFDGVNDALRAKEPGLVIFDGGTCSRGPLSLLGLPPLTGGRSRGGGGGGGGEGEGEGIDVDAEREALERLVALSPSTSALDSERDRRRREQRAAAAESGSPEADWSSLEGGGGLDGDDDDESSTDGGGGGGDIEILDIAASPDSGEDPEATVSVIESCLAWGGEQRLRVQLTLSVSDGTSLLFFSV